MCKREDFGRIGERNWPFTGRIEGIKEVDEEGDKTQMGLIVLRDPEAEASGKQSPAHVRKREQEQCSSTKRVNRPNGWPREDKVD